MILIEQLRAHYKENELLRVFEVARSSINYRRQQQDRMTPKRARLKGEVGSVLKFL